LGAFEKFFQVDPGDDADDGEEIGNEHSTLNEENKETMNCIGKAG
jgi:hypothetical protein